MIGGGIFTAPIFGVTESGDIRISAPAFSVEIDFTPPKFYQYQVISVPPFNAEITFTAPTVENLNIITIKRVISSGPDDCQEVQGGSFNNSSTLITVDGEDLIHGGFRFVDLALPPSAEILSAKITLEQADPTAVPADLVANWYAWDTDDAGRFSDAVRPSAVSRTTATEPFINAPSSNFSLVEHDVTSIVQEIVLRDGWASGSAINFIALAESGGYEFAGSYESPVSQAAKLTVEALSPDKIFNVPALNYELTFSAPAVSLGNLVNVPAINYALTFTPPSVSIDYILDVPPILYEVSFGQASVYQDLSFSVPAVNYEITFSPPEVTVGYTINAPSFGITIDFTSPAVWQDHLLEPPSINYTVSFTPPSVYQDAVIDVPALEYTVAFTSPTVSVDYSFDVPAIEYAVTFTPPEFYQDQLFSVPPILYGVVFTPPTVTSTSDININAPGFAGEVSFVPPVVGGDALFEVPYISIKATFTAPVVELDNPAYEDQPGREPVTIVEIDQDFCSLTYGTSPCAASLGVTGARKCFNTLKTCQSVANFDKTTLTLRFCMPTSSFDRKVRAIPTVTAVGTNPTEINIGGGDINQSPLGRRASVTVDFRDIPYNDRLVDKYRTERSYKPEDLGSFWSKWLARNPYYQNRPIRIREGYIGQSVESMRTRHYFIDKIDGPDSNGRVKVTAKDVLKFADNKKAQCPKPSNGRLDRDIDSDDTYFSLLPEDIGEEYPESGVAIIGDELVSFTRSGDDITLTGRALRGTNADDHEQDDSFQLVQVFDGVRVDEVIKTLLEDFANVPSEFIPFTQWQEEAARWLSGYELNTWITEPTGVSDLLGELMQQCICYIWWDEYDQEIKFKPIRPIDPAKDTLKIVDENSNIVAESLRVERDPAQRLSQVWFFYRQNNPVEDLEDPANYSRLNIRADLEAESELQYGESRISKIYSRWFTAANAGQVITTGTQLLLRYRDNPLIVTLSLDAKDRDLKTGDVVRVTHRSIVDETGQPIPTLLQVIKTHETEQGHKVEYKCQVFGFVQRYSFIMDNDAPDYDEATDEQKNAGMWISENEAPYFPDGSDAYRII